MRKMTGLLYKDLRLQIPNFIVAFAVGVGFILLFSIVPVLIQDNLMDDETNSIVCNFMQAIGLFCYFGMMEALLMRSVFMTDETHIWAGFALSCPDNAKMQVRAKYEFNLLAMIFYLITSIFSISLGNLISGIETSTISIAALSFFLLMLFAAIEFPFVVRFNTSKADKMRVLPLGIIFGALILYGLFGDLSIFSGVDMEAIFESIFDVITGKKQPKALTVIITALPFVSVIGYALSYKLSCKLYRKGVLTYDK